MVNELSSYDSSAIFPAYAAASAMQLLLAQIAVAGGSGLQAQDIRREVSERREKILGWADASKPTNPLALANTLVPEMDELREFTTRYPFKIKVAEAVTWIERQENVPDSSPPKTRTAYTWEIYNYNITFNGFSADGGVRLAGAMDHLETYLTNVPERFNFYKKVGMYPDATPRDLLSFFPCLKNDDGSYTSWGDGEAEKMKKETKILLTERAGCIRDNYIVKRNRLSELIDLDTQYKASAAAILLTAQNLDTLQI